MSGIDQFLAQHYGTVPTEPSQEDLQKVAQAELFLKLAANNGVDINQLNDGQINELWGQVFGEEKLAEAAQMEHELAKAAAAEAQEKFAEADYMGRIMAHSYVNELRGIAAEGGLDFMKIAEEAKTHWLRRGWEAVKHQATGRGHLGAGWQKLKKDNSGNRQVWEGVKELGKGVGHAAVIPGSVAAVGAGGYGIHRALRKKDEEEESKESSVRFDNAAAELAVEKAAEAGWDASEAIERLNSLFTLGYEGDPTESAKVAYAQTGDQALTLRAMELLELAGYPINW